MRHDTSSQRQHLQMRRSDLLAALFGLAAAWIAVGATGVLAHPLRHALTWLALCGVAMAAPPHPRPKLLVLAAVGLVAALIMTATPNALTNLCAVAFALIAVAAAAGERAVVLRTAAEAVAVLSLFHFARTSIPFVWQATDAVSTLAGRMVGAAVDRPLWVGSGFGGADYFVTMTYLAVIAPFRSGASPQYRRRLAISGLVAVMLGHALFLAAVSAAADAGESLANESPGMATSEAEDLEPWKAFVLAMIPWNLPLIGLLIHLPIAAVIFKRAARATETSRPIADESEQTSRPFSRTGVLTAGGGVLLTAALVAAVAPTSDPTELQGKRVVLYEKGFVNWLRPTHGQYGRLSVGMYGMLPSFLRSLGADTVFSDDLSNQDLRDADVLVLIYPDQPWEPGQLERIWDFVRSGGSLLVMGEHTVRDEDGASRFNQVLEPTAMRVRFDSATFAVGGWLQSYETMWHPTTAGVRDAENDFGVVIGASVRALRPARPLIVGRWGWADPGDVSSEAAMMGNGRYDAGERLGDVVLAAEQSFGKGKIIVFGDTSGLSNGINIGCHPFTARLFAYLADGNAQPLTPRREALGVLAVASLAVLVAARPAPLWLASAIASLALTTTLLTAHAHSVPPTWHRNESVHWQPRCWSRPPRRSFFRIPTAWAWCC